MVEYSKEESKVRAGQLLEEWKSEETDETAIAYFYLLMNAKSSEDRSKIIQNWINAEPNPHGKYLSDYSDKHISKAIALVNYFLYEATKRKAYSRDENSEYLAIYQEADIAVTHLREGHEAFGVAKIGLKSSESIILRDAQKILRGVTYSTSVHPTHLFEQQTLKDFQGKFANFFYNLLKPSFSIKDRVNKNKPHSPIGGHLFYDFGYKRYVKSKNNFSVLFRFITVQEFKDFSKKKNICCPVMPSLTN